MNSASTDLHPDFGPSFGDLPRHALRHPDHRRRRQPRQGQCHVPVRQRERQRAVSARRRTPRSRAGSGSSGDRHTIIVDRSTCRLYETWATRRQRQPVERRLRRGLESQRHALRPRRLDLGRRRRPADPAAACSATRRCRRATSTTPSASPPTLTARRYLWPARHQAGGSNSQNVPPMGARFRLKANFPIAPYRADTRAVLRAMKTYGLVLADNGSNWFFQGTADPRWQGSTTCSTS